MIYWRNGQRDSISLADDATEQNTSDDGN